MKTTDTDTDTGGFTYDRLSPDAQRRALDKLREWAEFDGSDYCSYVKHDILPLFGMSAPGVFYTGFSSQGDGACFTGRFYIDDVTTPDEVAEFKDDELTRIHEVLRRAQAWAQGMNALFEGEGIDDLTNALCASISHIDRYCHANSVDFSWEGWWTDEEDDGIYDLVLDFQSQIEEALRDLMRWIYRQLEADCDYQMSDDVLIENAEANDYRFDGDGYIL